MKRTAFWNAAPCSPVEIVRRFRDAYCFNHKGDTQLLLGISIDMKFHIDIGNGYINIQSFNLVRKILIAPSSN
jgi:hypothetical protein